MEDFEFKIIEESQEIPESDNETGFLIVVFFISADKDFQGKHFTVFIHDKDIQQIYYFDPLGIV